MDEEPKIVNFPQKANIDFNALHVGEFLASARLQAVGQMGEDEVRIIDQTIGEFAEEEEFDPAHVHELIDSIGGEDPKFNSYHFIAYARERAKIEALNDSTIDVNKRTTQIFDALLNPREDK